MKAMTQTPPQTMTVYPETDGKPMAETDVHIDVLIYLREALKDYFRHAPLVYVAGNMLLYYEEGNPQARVAPDVFVVKGIPKRERRIYKLWEEGKAPDVVIEITSRSTRLEDQGTKRAIYAMLGVKEYLLYDPLGEYLSPTLQGYRLRGGEYELLPPAAGGGLVSAELGLEFRLGDGRLRAMDSHTGEPLLTPAEAQDALRLPPSTYTFTLAPYHYQALMPPFLRPLFHCLPVSELGYQTA